MSNPFYSNKEKNKLDLNYKYGKLYAINLIIDKEEKDLYNLKSYETDNVKTIQAKELELKKSKAERDRIYKELFNLNKKI